MSRPNKPRFICEMPNYHMFGPKGRKANQLDRITLLVDEYEVIRLIDLLNMDQAEAARQLGVARTTVQRIYNIARQKIADAIVHGKLLLIDGGEYILCEEDCEECFRHIKHQHNHRGGRDESSN